MTSIWLKESNSNSYSQDAVGVLKEMYPIHSYPNFGWQERRPGLAFRSEYAALIVQRQETGVPLTRAPALHI